MFESLDSALDASACATIALAIFAGTFFAVGARTLRAGRRETDRRAAIPLSDDMERPRNV